MLSTFIQNKKVIVYCVVSLLLFIVAIIMAYFTFFNKSKHITFTRTEYGTTTPPEITSIVKLKTKEIPTQSYRDFYENGQTLSSVTVPSQQTQIDNYTEITNSLIKDGWTLKNKAVFASTSPAHISAHKAEKMIQVLIFDYEVMKIPLKNATIQKQVATSSTGTINSDVPKSGIVITIIK